MIELVYSFVLGIIVKFLYDVATNVKVSKNLLYKFITLYYDKLDLNNDDSVSLYEIVKFIRRNVKCQK